MSVMMEELEKMKGKDILVVQIDGRVFKGTLVKFDEYSAVLENVIETSTLELKWKIPLVSIPPLEKKDSYGEYEEDIVSLTTLLINLNQVLRIWDWKPEKYEKVQKYVIQHRKQERAGMIR